MAYGWVRCRLYPGISFPCYANASTLSSNFLTLSWRFCVAAGGSTVTSARFYSDNKEPGSSDVFSLLLSKNSSSEINGTSAMGSQKDSGQETMIQRYNLYKGWLASIMGEDPKKFDKSDLNRAIKYLLPSGLYAKDSRPLLQDPDEVFESYDAYKLGPRGRPLSAAFYTGRVDFHDLLYEIYEETAKLDDADTSFDDVIAEQAPGTSEDETLDAVEEEIAAEQVLVAGEDEIPEGEEWDVKAEDELGTNEHVPWQTGDEEDFQTLPEDATLSREKRIMEAMIRKKLSRGESDEAFDPTNRGIFRKVIQHDEVAGIALDTSAEESTEQSKHTRMRWLSKDELQRLLRDALTDKEYEMIIHRLKKLSTHQNAHLATTFLKQFLHPVEEQVPKATKQLLNLQGEAFGMGHRKRAIAKVLVKKGSGNVTVNDVPLTQYFTRLIDRQQIMFPFIVTNAVCEYDVRCNVIGGGNTGQAGAIRLATSRALLNFNDSYEEPLQQAGLLIRDPRIKERKKAGQKKARKKFAWVRR